MLGKLYITANSDLKRLQTAESLVLEAIDNKVAGDATSRTALNKLHAALSKAMGEAARGRTVADETVAAIANDGLTVVDEPEATAMETGADVNMEAMDKEEMTDAKDSMLDELLDDESALVT